MRRIHSSFTFMFCVICLFVSCSVQHQIGRVAKNILIENGNLANAHIGISIFDPLTNKYIYNYQGEKYFVPASNTKIFTCYAGLKYLGDSLPGVRYLEDDTAIYLFPTGDPTLLHNDFTVHPVIDFLKNNPKSLYIINVFWKTDALGSGWSWNDYNDNYMVERSPLPVYGNVIRWIQERTAEESKDSMAFDQSLSIYSSPEVNWKVRFTTELSKKSFFVQRGRSENIFDITEGTEDKKEQEVPFVTNGLQSALELLQDTIYKPIVLLEQLLDTNFKPGNPAMKTIFSRLTDSVLKPMMQRSDNFFAEQVLLMSAYEKFGVLNEDSIISAILNKELIHIPQRPRWADGSGLSRYNLFTPQRFFFILNKMANDFSMDRLKKIFPTPTQGTLWAYQKADSNYLFAKTGTLSGVVALSGFLYTNKGRFMIFSILVNNHRTSSTEVRKRIQGFLAFIRGRY